MTRTSKWICLALCGICVIAVLGACSNDKEESEDSASAEAAATVEAGLASLSDAEAELVRKAAAIADAIEAAPQAAAKILMDNQMTAEEYEALIYRISADEKLAAAYEEARK